MIKKRSLVSIFMLIIFLSNLGISVSSAETRSTISVNIADSISSISSFPSEENRVDYRIVQIDKHQNLDGNIFQDSFESKLLQSEKTVIFDAILSFDRQVGADEHIFLAKNDIEIVAEYDVIYGMHIRATAESLLRLSNLKNAHYIEESVVGKALLYNVTEQFGVRDIWQVSLGMGYTGNSDKAIAILDTGIDDTHLDSAFTLAYWEDFIGISKDVSSDEYATPTDKAEHGTHCASIAASSGAQTTTGAFDIQDSGYFPLTEGNSFIGTWFYVGTSQTVTIYLTWEGGGTAYAGFLDSSYSWMGSNYGTGGVSGGSGTYALVISTPGWYTPAYGSYSGATNNYYSAEVQYNSGWTNPYVDGYGPFTGVAPDSKIVGLKVLDDFGSNYASQLISGLDWLYNYGQTYDVTVASMSLGFGSVVSSVDTAITNIVRDKGIVCVAAAGNGGTSAGGIFSPGSCVDVITVGAVNKANEIAYYSSVGSALYPHIDVVAPGGSWASSGSAAPYQPIIAGDSNDGDDSYNYNYGTSSLPGNDYYSDNFRGMQGTSMACPFVAGLAQLVIDAMIDAGDWEYSWDVAKKVKQVICMGTSELRNLEGTTNGGETYDGDSDGTPQVTSIDRTFKDYTEGWGSIYPIAAIEAVNNWTTVGVPETVSLSGKLGETRVVIRQVDLESDTLYRIDGNFTVNNFIDADILLFQESPSDTGDPVLRYALTLGIVANESMVFSIQEDAKYYFVVKWVDGSFQGDCTFSIESIIDNQSHNYGDVLKSGTKITFDIDTTSLTSVTYKWDNDFVSVINSPYEFYIPVNDGEHVLTIYVQDVFGNNGELTYLFITDDTAPVIELTSPDPDSVINPGQYLNFTITDSFLLDNVWYNWDSLHDVELEYPYNFQVTLEDVGNHILNISAVDKAGNQASESFVFNIQWATSSTSVLIPIFTILSSVLVITVVQRKKK